MLLYLYPDTSSQPEPKHQHKPPALRALGAKPRQWLVSCVYFPRVTSTCVANALSVGHRGSWSNKDLWCWERSYAIGVRNEQLPHLRDSTSSPITNRVLCSTTFVLSIGAFNGKLFFFCFVRNKTVTQHNCWYVLWEMRHCCSCKQLVPFSAVCIYCADRTAAGEESRLKFTRLNTWNNF